MATAFMVTRRVAFRLFPNTHRIGRPYAMKIPAPKVRSILRNGLFRNFGAIGIKQVLLKMFKVGSDGKSPEPFAISSPER
jgi:hypothetical protein